jgi:uncharacterized protein (TIGR03435 family)
MLIEKAFGVEDFQISGCQAWLATERYDLVAKTERKDIDDDHLWLLLEPLLRERFGLKFHPECKPLSGLGARHRQASADPEGPRGGRSAGDADLGRVW